MSANLLHALYDHRDPSSEAFRFHGSAPRTTGDLRRSVGQFAQALRDLDVKKGDRVSFKLEKSEEVLFLAHACLQIGAILHPLNTAYVDREVADLVNDAEPRLVVCPPDEAERLRGLCGRPVATLAPAMGGTLGQRASVSDTLPDTCATDPGHIAAILYTSGTTGRPKGACITHGNLAESARALSRVWRLDGRDRLLHALPLYHAHGLLTSINTLLVSGGSILFLPRFDAAEVQDALPEATVVMGVPTHYARLCREAGLAVACRNLRLAISGSAPLSGEVAARFQALTGRHIIERYGATETAIVTAIPAGVSDRAGFVGWALPGIDIRVAQADGHKAEKAATGSLETRGHNVFAGYWRRPDADAEAFTDDGWFITGDIAEIDATGCTRLLGRSKDLIISGGLNVYPKEVEDVLDTLLAGGESAVFGIPHPDFGEAVVAAIEPIAHGKSQEADLLRELRVSLAAYKVPKRIIAVASIPRNPTGKVLKKELRETYRDLFVSEAQSE